MQAAASFTFVVLILFSPWLASAQTTGTLRGQVTDPSAASIPNATVQVSGSGVNRNTKTDAQGRFTIAVPPGTYQVQATASGFVTFSKTNVSVSAGQASALDISLQIAAAAQEVDVSAGGAGQVSTDPSSNAGALVLKNEDLDQLPDDPDDLQADLEALAGPAAGPSGAQFFVDGFSGGQLPPKSSIREIRINSNPFSSEFDRPGFGRIEIFTKPGTDRLRGQAFYNMGDSILDTRNPLIIGPQPAYTSKLFGGNLSGPLSKKASFFLDFNRRQIDEGSLVDARYLNSALQEVPFNGVYPTPQRFWLVSPRIDYQLNASNTLVLRYNHTANSTVGGVGQFSLPTQETTQQQKNNTVQATETMIIGTKAVDETRFQFFDSHVNQAGLGNFSIPGLDVSSSFNSGGTPFSLNFNDTKNYEVQNILTLSQGKHAIKIGGRLRQSDLTSQTNTNFNGTYTFAQPVQPATGTWCLAGYTNPTSLDLYQQTQILINQGVPMSQILAEGCGPTQFSLSSGIPLTTVRQLDLGLFVQDDWRIRPNLTISPGLRYETQNNIHDHEDWAPRMAVAWAPGGGSTARSGNSKTVIRAGWGVFFDRFPNTDVLSALRFNGVTQTNYLINNSLAEGGSAAAQTALSYYPNLPPVSLLSVQSQALYEIDKNLRAPYMMQSAVGVERSLPAHTTLSVNLIDTRGLHVLRQRDINAYLPGTYTGAGTGIRPYPTNDDIYLYESSGIFKQIQLITNVNSRVNNHLSIQGYYTYGQAHSNANGFPMDQYNDDLDYGRAVFDVRHRAFIGGNVGLPLGLVVAPFVTMSSGAPFNITTGSDFDGDGIFNQRPALATGTCGTATPNLRCTPFGTFNILPAAGQTVIPYNYGNGPAQFSANFRLSRTWGWGEPTTAAPPGGGGGPGGPGGPPGGGPGGGGGGRGGGGGGGFAGGGGGRGGGGMGMGGFGGTGKRYNLTLTLSARNAFNHVNYGAPNGVLTSPFFGESTTLAGQGGGTFGGAGTAAGNRRVELQLRLTF
jgi:hypothetical protein